MKLDIDSIYDNMIRNVQNIRIVGVQEGDF